MQDPEDIPADWSGLIRIGTVTSVDHAAARIVVRYGDPDDEDGGAETPPIPWAAPRAGGTRVWSPPAVGEQVLIIAPDAQLGAAVAIGGIHQDAFPPAANSAADVMLFADGARIAYDAEAHELTAVLPGGGTAVVEAPGGLTIRGPITIEGNVTIEGDVAVSGRVAADTDVTGAGISLKSHVHAGVQPGGGNSGPPH